MKKLSLVMALIAMICVLGACASAPAAKGPEVGKYLACVNGYDWGTGMDKVIVNVGSKVEPDNVKPHNFNVYKEAEGFDWVGMFTTGQMNTTVSKEELTVTDAYVCDAAGNKVTKASEYVAVELKVDPNTNAYLYFDLRDFMNHIPSVFNLSIANAKLRLVCTEGSLQFGLADRFVRNQKHTADGITLTYASYRPDGAKKGKTPLIVWLHGMGEGGTDSIIPLMGNKVANLASDEIQKNFGKTGAYVLVPQADGFWMQIDKDVNFQEVGVTTPGVTARSCYTDVLFSCIDSFVKANPDIDPNRVYVGGCSNGGYMTVNMLIEFPDYFAAAYPVCEAYPDEKIDEDKLQKLAKQNIWFVQAQNDGTVNPPEFDVATVDRLRKAGAKNVKFNFPADVHDETGLYKTPEGEPYQYDGHWSWIYVLNNTIKDDSGLSIMEWLAAQSK